MNRTDRMSPSSKKRSGLACRGGFIFAKSGGEVK